jgi:hypothetical protein
MSFLLHLHALLFYSKGGALHSSETSVKIPEYTASNPRKTVPLL